MLPPFAIIHNLRLGFATNSSSVHSIVRLADGSQAPRDSRAQGEYGWAPFVLSSGPAKARYLAAQLYTNLVAAHMYRMPSHVAEVYARQCLATAGLPEPAEPLSEIDIDHQSVFILPAGRKDASYSWSVPDMQYFKYVCDAVMAKDVVIIGGNDNEEMEELPEGFRFRLPKDDYSANWRVQMHKGYCALMNTTTGAKLRVSLEPGEAPVKASWPELVDIKITDYCDRGCAYCYQGSTTTGQHAKGSVLYSLADALREGGTLEVALGGGEPTAVPSFKSIVETFRHGGDITVNFSTRNLEWFGKNGAWFLENCGGAAISVDQGNIDDVELFLQGSVGGQVCRKGKISLQIIPEILPEAVLKRLFSMARTSRVSVTLLGYKQVGRAAPLAAVQPWVEVVDRLLVTGDCPSLGVDTMIAKNYQEWLTKAGIDQRLYTMDEGKFSCYVNAVAGTIGPSSYDIERLVKVPHDRNYGISSVEWGTAISDNFPGW